MNSWIAYCNSLVSSGLVQSCQGVESSKQDFYKFEKDSTIPTQSFNLNGNTVTFLDYSFFVQPKFFEQVVKPLKAKAGSDEKTVSELFNILKQGPTYVNNLGDSPRYPVETLTGAGEIVLTLQY